MTVKIDLPGEAERALKTKAAAAGLSAERYAQHLLERDLGVEESAAAERPDQPLRSVTEEILRRVRKLPPEALEGLPQDGAAQVDHYIYGTPKRDGR